MRLHDLGLSEAIGAKVALFQVGLDAVSQEYLQWLQDRQVSRYLEARFQRHSIETLALSVADCLASETTLLLGIRTLDESRHIGNIKLNWDAHRGVGDIGIMIGDTSNWGHGYATESIAILSRLAFDHIGLRKIVAGMYEGNRSGIRAFEHAEFQVEARLKDQVPLDGRPTDVLVMRRRRKDGDAEPDSEMGALTAPEATLADPATPPARPRSTPAPTSALDATTRGADPAAWDEVWHALPYQGVAYGGPMIDYQHAYLRGAGWELRDASLVLRTDGRPCGLWPLTVGGPGGSPRLTSAGSAVLAPVFIAGLPPRTVKKICTRAIAHLRALCIEEGLPPPAVEQGVTPGLAAEGASEWHVQLMAAGAQAVLRHDLYTDLRPALADIRAGFRKSFRPLINVGLRHWAVFVLDQVNASAAEWAEFKQLHRDVSGRSTRSDETWTTQFAMLGAGQAFLVGLRNPVDQRLVGAGFFQCTRDEGLYAVGAYDRSLFDKPLGHVVQQRAIETMKARGVRWYRIGERHYPQDEPPPTGKEVAISAFKQGFASHQLCRVEFALPLAGDSVEQARE